jgi:hypothetical protein
MSRYEINKAYTDLGETLNTDPIPKIESYDAIIIETNRLLQREHTLFVINSIVTIGLIITVFKVI